MCIGLGSIHTPGGKLKSRTHEGYNPRESLWYFLPPPLAWEHAGNFERTHAWRRMDMGGD